MARANLDAPSSDPQWLRDAAAVRRSLLARPATLSALKRRLKRPEDWVDEVVCWLRLQGALERAGNGLLRVVEGARLALPEAAPLEPWTTAEVRAFARKAARRYGPDPEPDLAKRRTWAVEPTWLRQGVRLYCGYQTHCPQGHPYEGDNLLRPDTYGRRGCRACLRAYRKKLYRKRQAAKGRVVGLPSQERTHCPKGHPYDGGNLLAHKTGGYTWRKCKACEREGDRRRRCNRRSVRS